MKPLGAVDELYRAQAPQAIRLARLLLADYGAAEDVVQEAFVRLLGRLHSIRDPAAMRSYLTRAVINLSKNHQRRAARLRRRELSVPEGEQTLPDIAQRDELHQRLMLLPYRQRVALVLRYCEDMSELEVAETMATSPKAVRSLAGRGLSKLRESAEGAANG